MWDNLDPIRMERSRLEMGREELEYNVMQWNREGKNGMDIE